MYLILSHKECTTLAQAIAPVMRMDPVACETLVPVDLALDEIISQSKQDWGQWTQYYGGGTLDLTDGQYDVIIHCTDWRPECGPFW